MGAAELELENKIAAAARAVAFAVSRAEKDAAIQLINALVKQRSPETVAAMEIAKGLR